MIVATGGGTSQIAREAAAPVQVVAEFDAWAAGARLLARREGLSVPKVHLVVSLGTGTSILLVGKGAGPVRIGGTGLGGGALVGLGKLLLGLDSFREIVELAEQGDRRRVDLLVGDIYTSDAPPLAAELNAASFGKLQSVAEAEPADVAHALCGLIAENIALITAQLARQHGARTILFCGSTLDQNRPLRQILVGTARMTGLDAHVVEAGAFAGALGALSLAQR
jgi:type II pantothenate kinase